MIISLSVLGTQEDGKLKGDYCTYNYYGSHYNNEFALLLQARDTAEKETGLTVSTLQIVGSPAYIEFIGEEVYFKKD